VNAALFSRLHLLGTSPYYEGTTNVSKLSGSTSEQVRCRRVLDSVFASALSTLPDLNQALEQVCETALGQLQARPDLAILFISTEYPPRTMAWRRALVRV